MKRLWFYLSIFAAALTILAAYYFYLCMQWSGQESLNRAEIAKMLAFLKYDRQECEKILEQSDSKDLPKDIYKTQWYNKYIVVSLKENWMCMDENQLFHPTEAFTYGDLKRLLDMFYISDEQLSFSVKYRQTDAMVSKKHWYEVYQRLAVDCPDIQKTSYTLFESASNTTDLEAWQILTDAGVKSAEGIAVETVVGKNIEVYEACGEILCILSSSEAPEAVIERETRLETTENDETKLRVLLQANTGGYGHDTVCVTSQEAFYVMTEENIYEYPADSKMTIFSEDDRLNGGIITIKSVHPQGKIQMLSIERSCGNPSYHGEIELQKSDEGILVINEVSIEDYVAGVIPGEMPISYGSEALKAQAVCARTFGERAIGGLFQDYPAHLDDTIFSQVYNNVEECEESIQAAQATKGQVLKNSEGLTETYFFSTSCGHTANSEEVWYTGDAVKDNEAVTVFLSDDSVRLSLENEADFRKFIQCTEDISYYEAEFPWFRWHVFITDETIEDKVWQVCGENIGDLIQITVLERGTSGVLKALQFEGTLGACTVYGEYRIRQIFSPKNAELTPQTGEIVTDWEMLPSGYFYMDEWTEEGQCAGYMLYGGGYGHGCGMSQNGAMKMAEAGKNYEEILKYFFGDSRLVIQ